MLVLSRKLNEGIVVADSIVITVIEVRGDKVRLGIVADKQVPVHRLEIWQKINGRHSPLPIPEIARELPEEPLKTAAQD